MNGRRGLLAAILLLVGANGLQAAGADAQWLGVLWTKGVVSVGDAEVSSRTTILPGDVITTAPDATAWLRFRSPVSTVLLADTQLTVLGGEAAPGILLRRGTVIVEERLADPIQITLPGGFVLVQADPQAGAECEMAAVENTATVSVTRGLAEIHGQGAPVILRPGQSTRVEAGPQGSSLVAGKVSRVIPQGVIQRQGELSEVKELPLKQNEVVDWNDLVRTIQLGRAQIMLLDGSTLNVGARSEIRIVKHDPTAQQTIVELTAGEVQANVEKITAPGGKFELHTKSAVIGTVDTYYVAMTDETGTTRVCGVKGTTEVGSSDPNIPKKVRLHKNECTVVLFGGAPIDPVLAPGEVASMLTETSVQAGGVLGSLSGVQSAVVAAGAAGAIASGVVLNNLAVTTPTTP